MITTIQEFFLIFSDFPRRCFRNYFSNFMRFCSWRTSSNIWSFSGMLQQGLSISPSNGYILTPLLQLLDFTRISSRSYLKYFFSGTVQEVQPEFSAGFGVFVGLSSVVLPGDIRVQDWSRGWRMP